MDDSPLYWSLAATHGWLILSSLPGLALWMAQRLDDTRRAMACKAHIVALTSALAGLGILGIPERGSLVLFAIALLSANLVFQIRSRQRLWFNLGISIATALALLLFSAENFFRSLILLGRR